MTEKDDIFVFTRTLCTPEQNDTLFTNQAQRGFELSASRHFVLDCLLRKLLKWYIRVIVKSVAARLLNKPSGFVRL